MKRSAKPNLAIRAVTLILSLMLLCSVLAGTGAVGGLWELPALPALGTAAHSCAAIGAVCAAVILLLNWKWFHRGLRCIGLSLLLGSLPCFVPTCMALAAAEQPDGFPPLSPGVQSAVTAIARRAGGVSTGIFAAGVLLCVAAFAARIIARNRVDVVKEFTDALIEPTGE